MKRAMSVWLPRFPIDLLLRRSRRNAGARNNAPVVIAQRQGQKQIVVACCARAQRAGVRPGLTLGDAKGVLPTTVRVEQARPEKDRSALEALALWAQRFSPVVAVDEPDGLLIDVSGCARVFKGEEHLLAKVKADLLRLGFISQTAIAPTFGCAWGVARYGTSSIIAEGESRTALAGLPVSALHVDVDVVAALAEVGIERVDHLFGLPRSVLPARFGGVLLLQLDRALGHALEIIRPVRPTESPKAERVFDGPTTQLEAVELTARDLLLDLSQQLAAFECGVRRLEVILARVDVAPVRITLTLGRPSREAKHLWRLLRPHLERANLGFGVEAVTMIAARTGRLRHVQAEHWRDGASEGAQTNALSELLDTLGNRLGHDHVQRAVLVESHLPERSFRLQPVISESTPGITPAVVHADRPTVLYEQPHPLEVVALSPDGPVHRVRCAGVEWVVTASIGPERIDHEWWHGTRPVRDYFKVQESRGCWSWIFRTEHGDWFLHGVWA